MSWHKIVFKQIQPIHLGHKKHGVINETRIFITGQMMWGALTNAYFHKTNQYDEGLFENISCFYPMSNDEVLLPKFKDGEFCLGDMSEKEFRQKYVTTLLSTAINPNTLNAKDESLHELDVILPDSLQWVGYIKCEKAKIEAIKEIFIGGDSRYGLGLMRREHIEEESYSQNPIKGKMDNATPNEPLTNFVKFDKQKFEGKLELLAEFSFKKNSPEITTSETNGLYISVGSVLAN
ncbi:MAG: hypothetical protein KU38_04500 [Sulfurovum sp. FS08-3]|nr:MAG: hypothetical protein KU38_04500 [Sulfurovum sp. FS08-3]